MPSATPRFGLMKTSSVGMLGLKVTPPIVSSEPPQKRASGIMPTVKSVPFEAWYSSVSMPRELRYSQRAFSS